MSAELEQLRTHLEFLENHGALAGVGEVIRERRRQVELGYSVYEDDRRTDGWLVMEGTLRAAGAYKGNRMGEGPEFTEEQLREAAALLAAEVDRLNRMLAGCSGKCDHDQGRHIPLKT